MNVSGNMASVGGVITKSDFPPDRVGTGLTIFVEDLGEPGVATDETAHDFASFARPAPGTDCRDPLDLTDRTIDTRNVQVFGG